VPDGQLAQELPRGLHVPGGKPAPVHERRVDVGAIDSRLRLYETEADGIAAFR